MLPRDLLKKMREETVKEKAETFLMGIESKRAYIQQGKVGIVEHRIGVSLADLVVKDEDKVEYLATSGIATCVVFTIYLKGRETAKTLLVHFDSGHQSDMAAYIKAFLDHIPSGGNTTVTIIPSSQSTPALLQTIREAVNVVYGSSGSNICPLPGLFKKSWDTEDVCVNLMTGEIKRYKETQDGITTTKTREGLHIPSYVQVFSLEGGHLSPAVFDDDHAHGAAVSISSSDTAVLAATHIGLSVKK